MTRSPESRPAITAGGCRPSAAAAKERAVLQPAPPGVANLAVSADGRTLATVGVDGAAELVELGVVARVGARVDRGPVIRVAVDQAAE